MFDKCSYKRLKACASKHTLMDVQVSLLAHRTDCTALEVGWLEQRQYQGSLVLPLHVPLR